MELTGHHHPGCPRVILCLSLLLISLCALPIAMAQVITPSALTITASPNPVVAGSGSENLLVTIRAQGLTEGYVNVTLTLPDGVTLETAQLVNEGPNSSLNATPTCCYWGVGSEGEILSLSFTVDDTANPADDIEILAQKVDSDIQSSEIIDIITGAPSLTLSLSDTPDPVLVGDNLQYTLVIDNQGLGVATSIDYQITFSPELSYVSGGEGNCDLFGSVLSCLINTPLNPGNSINILLQTTVDSAPPPNNMGDRLLFTVAEVAGTEPIPSASEETTVLLGMDIGPDLSLRKTAPSSIIDGDLLDYSLRVTNHDPEYAASLVTVIDYLPAGVTPVYMSPGCFLSATARKILSGSLVVCDISSLFPRQVFDIDIQVRVDSCQDTLLNQAYVSYSAGEQDPNGADPNPDNDSDSAITRCTVLPPVETADLSITKQDSMDPVPAGSLFTYTLRVRNQGPDTAENILLRDSLPDGVDLLELPLGCHDEGFQISCEFHTLGIHQEVSVEILVQTTGNPGDLLRNTATVDSDTLDPQLQNNRATEYTRIDAIRSSADLLLQIQAPSNIPPGESFNYQIDIMNAGVDSAESVTLSGVLDASLSLIDIIPEQGNCQMDLPLNCQLGTLDNGANIQVMVTVAPDPEARGELLSSASVTSPTPDPNTGNNSDSARTLISQSQQTLAVGQVCSRYRAVLDGPGEGEALTSPPPGLAFFEEQGNLILAGVPEVAGEYRIMVNFHADSNDTRQVIFEIVIDEAGLAISDPSPVPGQRLQPAIVDSPYGFQLRALGGNSPYRWEALSELPAGLALYDSGLLAGYPREIGDFALQVQVKDALDSVADLTLRLEVLSTRLQDRTPPVPNGLLGLGYQVPALLDGASPPFQCVVESGSLPPGIALDGACGLIGVPETAGDYPFSLLISSADPTLTPLSSNRRVEIVADTRIPQGQPPSLTPLPPVSIPVPEQCRLQLPPDEIIQQGTVDPFGNRYLVGHLLIQDQYDLLLSKYDPQGELLWEQHLDTGGDDFGYAVTLTADLNIIVAGLAGDGRRYQGLIAQYTDSGIPQWQQRVGDAGVNAFYGVTADTSGIYLVGERYNGANFDALLMALDGNGQFRWEVIQDTRDTETAYRVVLLPCAPDTPCELVVGGFRGENRDRGWLERRDLEGNLLARVQLNHTPVESMMLLDADLVVGGSTGSTWRVHRMSSDFDTRWSAQLPTGKALRAMAPDFEGNSYVVGRVDGNRTDQDGFIWVLSPDGVPLDQVQFDEGEDERFTAVMIDPAGRLSVAGQRRGGLGNRILLLDVDNGKRFELP